MPSTGIFDTLNAIGYRCSSYTATFAATAGAASGQQQQQQLQQQAHHSITAMLMPMIVAAPPATITRIASLAPVSRPVAFRNSIRRSIAGTADNSSTPEGSKRRKLFQDLEEHAASTVAASPSVAQSTTTAGTASGLQHAANLAAPLLQQQQQQQQQLPVPWPSTVQLHVYWDLDNLHPTEWLELPAVIARLRDRLQQYGSIAAMQAFACSRTLTRQVPGSAAAAVSAYYDGSGSSSSNARWGYDDVLDAAQTSEALTCPMCRRRCKTVADLNKHFLQLHTREHQKRLKGSKLYASSDKAQRYRDAVQQVGLPRPKLAGRKGQAVQLLLQQGNIALQQVHNTDQAADNAIKRSLQRLCESLPCLENHVFVLVSDDRGFRLQLNTFLQAGGAGVVLVTSRAPDQWGVPGTAFCNVWDVAEDRRVVFVSWDDILFG